MLNLIKKIIRKEQPQVQPVDQGVPASMDIKTSPLTYETLEPGLGLTAPRFSPAQIQFACAQSVGKQRDHNEDTLYCMHTMLADGGLDLPIGLFMVADGMGGHQFGEIASGSATRAMADYILQQMYLPTLHPISERSTASLQEVMEQGVKAAHQAVSKNAPGGGTTLTCAVIVGEQVTLAHVGDSRAYFIFPDGRIDLITKDHTLVHRLIELGQITESEALTHPNRNVVYRALGQIEPFRPDVETRQLPHPGYLMLCSDGLWGVVTETQIFEIIKNTPNLSEACGALVDAANAAGGPDNISVILVQYL